MSQNQDALKDLESETPKPATLSAEDRRAITTGLLESPVAQSLTDSGLQCQMKRRNLRKAGGPRRRVVSEVVASEPSSAAPIDDAKAAEEKKTS